MRNSIVQYRRQLPGGGFVTIETHELDGTEFYGQLQVERRSDPARRLGHAPPVVAEMKAPSRNTVFEELYRIANDNVAIARAILRWTRDKH